MPDTTTPTLGIEIIDNSALQTEVQQVAQGLPMSDFLSTIFGALLIGLVIAGCYMFRNRYSRSFVATLVMIPVVVSAVILIINRDIGAGIAVAGAFSLVRFRSIPGTAKELGMLFLAMGAGLAAGMGQLLYAIIFTVVLCITFLIGNHAGFKGHARRTVYRTFNITIPEDLDYTNIFDDLMEAYTTAWELARVKTTNMGSMFRLTYHVTLRDAKLEKSFIDLLRCRNGNLEITVSNQETMGSEL